LSKILNNNPRFKDFWISLVAEHLPREHPMILPIFRSEKMTDEKILLIVLKVGWLRDLLEAD
jgi:hypothetical protein